MYRIAGVGSGGWSIAQNTGQQIVFGNAQTTIGTGSIASTQARDSVELLYVGSNQFQIISSVGNILIN
jgi:hypothetical protein